ncbi:MAG: L-serine dehydratase 1 [Acidimicrobiales bacterium]|nr:L-serine dehydratase 1 [Acidimicrobiales bacterium]
MISAFELFSVGIGPSSSHTVGPMRAARRFAVALGEAGLMDRVGAVRTELFGSLGLTGRGHGTHTAVMLGLMGEQPDLIDPDTIPAIVEGIRGAGRLTILGRHEVAFIVKQHIVFHRRAKLPHHPNGLRFAALDADGEELIAGVYYSLGGGFIAEEADFTDPARRPAPAAEPYPFGTAVELLGHTRATGLPISGVVLANEVSRREEPEVRRRLLALWAEMRACVDRGLRRDGILPGGLKVPRRAPALHRTLCDRRPGEDPLAAVDWLNLWALAVNEENAGGGRIVTAPTNGAAGIIPAVMHYYATFVPRADDDGIVRFLLTAAAIGALFKQNASISGAEVGCQGEVGSACSMAAAGLAELLGGTPEQVENAAEIAMEHNLGLTCDPIGGLVQIPCIERNAIASVSAVNASRMALHGDGHHHVSLDKVIRTMRDTGRDMMDKYKETSRGGLAVNIVEC